MLKEYMKIFDDFYRFIKEYSPCDFKIIHRKPHVSQRVISQHVDLWNETHEKSKLRTLRVFFT